MNATKQNIQIYLHMRPKKANATTFAENLSYMVNKQKQVPAD